MLAALANGGSADNIAPGVDFFKKLTESGNLIPVDPAPATIAAGTTPIVIDWTYNEVPQIAVVQPKGIDWKVVIPSDAPPVGAYYNSAINKDAAHPRPPAAGWSTSSPTPARTPGSRAERCRSGSPACRRPAPWTGGPGGRQSTDHAPGPLTAAQIDAATKYLTDNWKFISIK